MCYNSGMAIDVGVRELRNHTADVISSVESGETVYLTSHRRRIAVITPVANEADGLAKLLAYVDGSPVYDSGLADFVAEQRAIDAALESDPWG